MKPPRRPKKTVRKRSKAGKRLVKSVKQATQMVRGKKGGGSDGRTADCKSASSMKDGSIPSPPTTYAAVGERLAGSNIHGIGPDTDCGPNPDYVPPQPASVTDIADEMRRVQEEETVITLPSPCMSGMQFKIKNNSSATVRVVQPESETIQEREWPEVEKKLKEQISFWRIGAITLMCLLPCATGFGMFTQSQLPQKPRLSEVSFCIHEGYHWNPTSLTCE